ncbi:MAG: 16S rRNA (cytidine(1402)-2'-O)-methyltransferase [Desulfurispora sp.]|uniref:16S rRNA (cytidine(1402)-2'-O)-methyltransferase n=1 Tax=Desulfurispora sp. TaxID=3014275 RepID=UPI00404A9D43
MVTGKPKADTAAPVSGTLYLCATPIGNLGDITLRALEVLRGVDLVAAEDTRRTRQLLAHYDIHVPLTSFHEHNWKSKGPQLVRQLQEGRSIALVTDAGMPGISDPGSELVALAVEAGLKVVPVPGATAAIAALVVSGLPAERFCFEGFLPARAAERRRALADLAGERRTLVFYEAVHRVDKTLADMLAVLGDRRICVARELTKLHEEIWRGTLSGAVEYFSGRPLKGEFTLVVEGAPEEGRRALDHRVHAGLDSGRQGAGTLPDAPLLPAWGLAEDPAPSGTAQVPAAPSASGGPVLAPVEGEALAPPDPVRTLLRELIAGGLSRRDAAAEAARRLGLSRRQLYRLAARLSGEE